MPGTLLTLGTRYAWNAFQLGPDMPGTLVKMGTRYAWNAQNFLIYNFLSIKY